MFWQLSLHHSLFSDLSGLIRIKSPMLSIKQLYKPAYILFVVFKTEQAVSGSCYCRQFWNNINIPRAQPTGTPAVPFRTSCKLLSTSIGGGGVLSHHCGLTLPPRHRNPAWDTHLSSKGCTELFAESTTQLLMSSSAPMSKDAYFYHYYCIYS